MLVYQSVGKLYHVSVDAMNMENMLKIQLNMCKTVPNRLEHRWLLLIYDFLGKLGVLLELDNTVELT